MAGNGNDQVRLVRTVRTGAYKEVRVRTNTYRGTPMLDIREFFADDNDEWRPSRKGVCFRAELVGEIIEGLNELQSQLGAAQSEDERDGQEAA